MTDNAILSMLKDNRQHQALTRLYTYLPVVEKLILSKGGTRVDAQDIYQEALIIFVRKVEEGNLVLNSSIDTYLYGICQMLWRNELRKRGTHQSLDIFVDLPEQNGLEEALLLEQRYRQAEVALNKLGERCKELLVLFYHKAMSMKSIATKMNLSSEKVAKNQKYKCLEKAKQHLQQQVA